MLTSQHWERVYQSKNFDSVSWYAPHLADSLAIIQNLCQDKASAIVDVGGGESTLVDDLLARNFTNISVLDVSATAIEFTKNRLGSKAKKVSWYVGDITNFDFDARQFDIWHDRAVFHFLTNPTDRKAYVDLVRRSVKKGGYVIMATFGPNGPLKCSNLDVARYDSNQLHSEFGCSFKLLGDKITHHITPANTNQEFLYCWCKLI